jgi:hypothetical protein
MLLPFTILVYWFDSDGAATKIPMKTCLTLGSPSEIHLAVPEPLQWYWSASRTDATVPVLRERHCLSELWHIECFGEVPWLCNDLNRGVAHPRLSRYGYINVADLKHYAIAVLVGTSTIASTKLTSRE